jgi:NAD(P)-dependent dehydrogenase (short-subunit alcohol dehydrogenase family)
MTVTAVLSSFLGLHGLIFFVCALILFLAFWILIQKYFGWFAWETICKRDTILNRNGYVLITGCSSGIGKDCVHELIRLGFSVFAGIRNEADAGMLKREIPSENLYPVIIDVTLPETIKAAKLFIKRAIGNAGLVALINNAGIAIPGPLEVIDDEMLKQQFDVNVFGVVRICRAFIPLLRKYVASDSTRGRIINISSIAGFLVFPGLGAYSASKYALEAITESLRLELKPWKIHVCSIQPSNIRTPIWDKGEEFYWKVKNNCNLTKQKCYQQLFSVLLTTGNTYTYFYTHIVWVHPKTSSIQL